MDISTELIRLFGLKSASQLAEGSEVFGDGGYLSFRTPVVVTKNDSKEIHVFIKRSDLSRSDLDEMQVLSNYFCRTECIFYGLMAPVLERVMLQYEISPMFPKAFGQRISGQGTILVMEDITKHEFHPVDRPSFTIEHVYCIVNALGGLQAAYWIARKSFNHTLDSVLFGTESQFSDGTRKSGVDLRPLMENSVGYFFENFSKYTKCPEDEAIIRDYVSGFVHALMTDPLNLLPTIGSKPIGLVHGDLWFNNCMFKGEGDSLVCRLFDWQFWDINIFGFDLALLMITSLSHEAMQEHVDKIPAVFYRTFRDIYEAKTGDSVPFTEEEALGNMRDSMCVAMLWILTTCKLCWTSGKFDVSSMLTNLAFSIRTGRVALPSTLPKA